MWLLIVVMLAFVILDRAGVLKCNTLFMSIMYIIGIPLLITGYFALMISDILHLAAKFSLLKLVLLIVGAMAAFPILVFMLYILFRLCKTPIAPERYSGADYELACAKRRRTLMWICAPLSWVLSVIAILVGVMAVAVVAGGSLAALNPMFWIMCILTFGAVFAGYIVGLAGIASVYLIAFMIFFCAAAFYAVVTMALMGTMLYAMRGRLGYSRLKNVISVISLVIPVWSLITMIAVTKDIKNLI